MEYANLIIAGVAFIVSLISLVFSLNAQRKSDNKTYNDYLLDKIILGYNKIEADIVLLDQGLIDEGFTADALNKEVILSLCAAKSKALSLGDKELFNFLNSILNGTDPNQMGAFIDEYFDKRKEFLAIKDNEEKEKYSKEVLVPMLEKTRAYRDEIINEVFRKIKLINR